jgi:RNA polymerase sigma factor (sigma-70 family)
MTPQNFFHLCTAIDPDHRQDQYLELLETKPTTESEASSILKRLSHRQQWNRRQEKLRSMPLLAEEATPDMSKNSTLAYLSELDEDSAAIIRLRVFQDQSFAEIAEMYGYSHETARRRYHAAIKKVLACVELT